VVLTRYFEYDFAWRRLSSLKIGRYLDVSSPFAFPILLVDRMPKVTADLVNPDGNDLPTTRAIACAAGLDRRCRFLQAVVDDIDAPPSSYDAVTCISVLEHIPDDRAALQRMWSLLRPGGTLIITVPCAARSYRLFTNRDHYGLLGSGEDGFTFLEYVYDEAQLAERVYAVTGSPAATEIWGEREPGFLSRELASRWSGAAWRYWEEPLLMARAFARYAKISELPGEGVVSLSFVKP
jgi:SAM-dependent methyltransferase